MSKMIQLVEEMRIRLNEIASSEQALVRALGDALSRVDHKLLQDVRSITAEHEARRGAIFNELQGLATRIGAFPGGREPAASLEIAPPPEPARAYVPPPAPGGPQHALNGDGDWRHMTANAIQDELNLHFKSRVTN